MKWQYIIMRHTEGVAVYYRIHEIYDIDNPKEITWSETAETPFGDTAEELKSSLRMMLKDISKAPVLDYETGKKVK